MSNEKAGILGTTAVFLALIFFVAIDEEESIAFAKAGLEECLVKNIPTSSGITYHTMWVKDCKTTLEVTKR